MNPFEHVAFDDRAAQRQRLHDADAEYATPAMWAEGPVKPPYRRTTDKLCLVLFLLALVAVVAIPVYAWANSQPRPWGRLQDSSGNICGAGPAASYPFLFLQSFARPYRSVCVRQCPAFDYNQIKYGAAGVGAGPGNGTTTNTTRVDSRVFSREFAGTVTTTNTTVVTEKIVSSYDPVWANGYFTEAQWNSYLAQFKLDCLPNGQVASCRHNPPNFYLYDSVVGAQGLCVPVNSARQGAPDDLALYLRQDYASDVTVAGPIFGWVALSALALSLGFLVLLAFVPTIVTWLLLVAMGLGFLALGVYTAVSAAAGPGPVIRQAYDFGDRPVDWLSRSSRWLLIAISVISFLLALATFWFIAKFRRYVGLSMSFIQLSARFGFTNIVVLLFAVLGGLLQTLLVILAVATLERLSRVGERLTVVEQQGYPVILYRQSALARALTPIFIVSAYWVFIVINNVMDFTTGGVTTNHYWKRPLAPFGVLALGLFTHLGSIAASLVLLPVYVFKVLFGWLDWLTTADRPNFLQRGTRLLLCPCCWLYDKLVDSVSESYLVLTYFGSDSFVQANKRLGYLTEMQREVSSTVSAVGQFLSLAGKLLIACAAAAIGHSIISNSAYYRERIFHFDLVLAICWLIGLAISAIFTNIFLTVYESFLVNHLVEADLSRARQTELSHSPAQLNRLVTEIKTEKVVVYEQI